MKFETEMRRKLQMLPPGLAFMLILFNCFTSTAQWASINPGRYDTTWWKHAPIRLIQTNLPEIDALMDVDA